MRGALTVSYTHLDVYKRQVVVYVVHIRLFVGTQQRTHRVFQRLSLIHIYILYVGVNDHLVDLFEGQYDVPNGMAYNSYLICDDKVAVMDSVDAHFTDEWITKIAAALGERTPDYFVVQHMEPDH